MLSVKDIRFAYEGASEYAVDGVSFELSPGGYTALLGANGSGKSTVVRLLGGFLLPSSGAIRVDGLSTEDEGTLRDLRCRLGTVFQDPDNQIVSSKVLTEVAFGPENLGLPREEIRRRAVEALETCGLAGKEDLDPTTLSGGERQRLVIAGILAMKPGYLVLDEPVSMLDGPGRRSVLDVVAKLHAQGTAVFHVTHDLSTCLAADKAIVLKEGRVVFEGAPGELLLQEKRFSEWGLSTTPMLDLSHELAVNGVSREMASVHPAVVAHDVARSIPPSTAPHDHGDHETAETAARGSTVLPHGTTAHEGRDGGLLVASQVTFDYAKGTRLAKRGLEGASLTVRPGEITLVSGRTGSGKSTLLSLLSGLSVPSEGSVLHDGRPVKPGQVGLVLQRPESQLFESTVGEDIAFGLRMRGIRGDECDRRVIEAMRYVQLDPDRFIARSPFTLSGGQARRAAIAGILALEQRFLLLDEPTVGFDASGRAFVERLIGELASEGRGIVVVSHEVERFLPLCDRVLLLDGGKTSWEGDAGTLIADPRPLLRAGLEVPELSRFQLELACRPGGLSLDVDRVARWALDGYPPAGPAVHPSAGAGV